MLPLKDNVPTRQFPVVTVALIVANTAVWLLWEKAGTGSGFEQTVFDGSFRPCEVQDSCQGIGLSWPVNVFTSMFMHASWEHILGNMLFLWIFGNNVEDTVGRARFVVFYLVGGIAATAVQFFVTLGYGTPADARLPNLGASGAIAAVLGAYFVLVPWGRVLTFVLPFFFFEIPAVVFLGLWFVYQLVLGGYSFVQPEAGGGVAFFAHVGGFAFGVLAVKAFAAGRPRPLRPAY
jgi:rhomboid family protein